MEFKLTRKVQYSKKCKDGKYRNFLIFFLNDVEIMKQKLPLADKRDARIRNIKAGSKEGGYRDDESIYTFTL
jgi:hypothetical protein